MKLKKIISIALSVMMLAQSTTLVLADNNHWAQKSIDRMTSLGIVEGNEVGDFMPNNRITRAELFTILNRITKISAISGKDIPDVAAGAWYKAETDKAVTDGYVSGYDDGTIRPENNITRAEAATLISRIFGANEYDASSFTDGSSIGAWAKDGIDALVSIGVISGYDDGSFRPGDYITRAEIVTMLDKLIGQIKNDRDSKELYGKTVEGNLILTSGRFVLENVTVNGNIYITNGASNDEVRLVNCTVNGDIFYGKNNTRAVVLDNVKANAVTAGGKNPEIVLVGETKISKIYSNGSKISTPDYTGEAVDEIIVTADTTIGVDASKVTVKETSAVTIKDESKISKLEVLSSARNAEIKVESGSVSTFETAAMCELNGETVKAGYNADKVGTSKTPTSENYKETSSGGSTGGGGGGGGGSASSGATPGTGRAYELTSLNVNVTRNEEGETAGSGLLTFDKETEWYNINLTYDQLDVKFDMTFTDGTKVTLNGITMFAGTPYTMENIPSGTTVVDILVFNGIKQEYEYHINIRKDARATEESLTALNTMLEGLAGPSAAQENAIPLLQAFMDAEINTAVIEQLGAYKTAYDTLSVSGPLTQADFVDMVANVNETETPDASGVLSSVKSISDLTITEMAISDAIPTYVYTGTKESDSVVYLDGVVNFYVRVPSDASYYIETVGSSVSGDKVSVTINDANTAAITKDLSPSYNDATLETVSHGTIELKEGLNKISIVSTNQSTYSKLSSITLAGMDSAYPPIGIVPIEVNASSIVTSSTASDSFTGGKGLFAGQSHNVNFNGVSTPLYSPTEPMTFYIKAETAGEYKFETYGGVNPYNIYGTMNIYVNTAGSPTFTGTPAPSGAASWGPHLKEWGTISLVEGYNKITIKRPDGTPSNDDNSRICAIGLKGPDVRYAIDNVTVEGATYTPAFDMSTTEYEIDLESNVESLSFTVDFTQFSKVKINGEDATANEPFAINNIPSGETTVTIVLYQSDDTEVETYVFNITKSYVAPEGTVEALNTVIADPASTPIQIMQAMLNAKLFNAQIGQVAAYQGVYGIEGVELTQKQFETLIDEVNEIETPDTSIVLPYILEVDANSNLSPAAIDDASPSYVYYGTDDSADEKELDNKIEFYVNAAAAGEYTIVVNAKALVEDAQIDAKVNSETSLQYPLTASYEDYEVYSGPLVEGFNKITLSQADAEKGVAVKALKVVGSNTLYMPSSKTAKEIASTGSTTLNFKADASSVVGGANDELGYYNEVPYNFKSATQAIKVYVDAPSEGVYYLAAIGKRKQNGDSATSFAVKNSSATPSSPISGTVSGDKNQTIAECLIGELTLTEGLNIITITSSQEHNMVGGIVIAPKTADAPPPGVPAMELIADGTATVTFTAEAGMAMTGGVYGGASWLASYEGAQLSRMRLSKPVTLHVIAPEAGDYNMSIIQGKSSYGYASNFTMSVNGTQVRSSGFVPSATTSWAAELVDWGTVTLEEGYNTITFTATNNHAFSGFVISGPDA